jgi:hypothetical protein
MEYLKRALAAFRAINLTSIGKLALSKLGGAWGWLYSFVGGLLLKTLEIWVDRKAKELEENIAIKQRDKEIEAERKAKADAVTKAETDKELDDAFDNSMR